MKALSLWQPWASLIAIGVKIIETRSWYTKHRGPLAIHASQRACFPDDPQFKQAVKEFGLSPFGLPTGAIVATCNLNACIRSEDFPTLLSVATRREPAHERARKIERIERQKIFGDYSRGRYLWLLSDIMKLETPIPARGKQGLWNWEEQ